MMGVVVAVRCGAVGRNHERIWGEGVPRGEWGSHGLVD